MQAKSSEDRELVLCGDTRIVELRLLKGDGARAESHGEKKRAANVLEVHLRA